MTTTISALRAGHSTTQIDVGNTPTKLPTTPRSNRKSMSIANAGSNTIYLGDSAVTISDGWPLAANASVEIDLDEGVDVYGIVAAGTEDCRVWEFD